MSIGERITQLRNNAELSQGDLAKLLGISRQAVSKWENDLSSPDTIRLIQLCDILNTDVEYLATGKSSTHESPPILVNLIKKEDRIIEKVVEKTVEKPVIKKIIRYRYLRNPVEYFIAAAAGLAVGFFFGWLL